MSRLRPITVGALCIATLLASASASAQQKKPTPAPPSGSVVTPAPGAATTPAPPPPSTPAPAPASTPAPAQAEPSHMPAIDFAVMGSVGGAWLARVSDSSDNNTSFALGMNNNGWGATVGVGLMPNERRGYGVMVRGRYVVGQTSLNLESHFAAIGAEMPITLMPNLSFVPTLRGDWLLIKRVTQSSAPDIQHWGYGAGLGLDYTFLRFSELAFFARPEVSGTIIPHEIFSPRSGLLSGVLMLGVRYLPD